MSSIFVPEAIRVLVLYELVESGWFAVQNSGKLLDIGFFFGYRWLLDTLLKTLRLLVLFKAIDIETKLCHHHKETVLIIEILKF